MFENMFIHFDCRHNARAWQTPDGRTDTGIAGIARQLKQKRLIVVFILSRVISEAVQYQKDVSDDSRNERVSCIERW